MRRNFGKRRLVYRDPIESMDSPSNMAIGYCWYQKGTNKKLIYALINFNGNNNYISFYDIYCIL